MAIARALRNSLASSGRIALPAAIVLTAAIAARGQTPPAARPVPGEPIATGQRITPTAAPGSTFQPLDPKVPGRPAANNGVTTAISPDGRTLLVLTSGYNWWGDPAWQTLSSDEYVFVYDISEGQPRPTQVITVPNTFMGLVWHPSGREFYVAGGVNDNVHVFEQRGSSWMPAGDPIALGHAGGNGLDTKGNSSVDWVKTAPLAAGVAVNRSGSRLLVTNLENDSISLLDLVGRAKIAELDLRPGRNAAGEAGIPGGEFPAWVAVKGDGKAYVSSLRDREVVVVDFAGDSLAVARRIRVPGNPGRMLLDRAQARLFVALDNSDSIAVIDTARDQVRAVIDVNTRFGVSKGGKRYTGSHPNSLALSRDESILYVTLGGTNCVAVVPVTGRGPIQLIPTGWYPHSISVAPDDRYLYVVNALGRAGANPDLKASANHNQYVLQTRPAGLLSMPVPRGAELASLTRQVLLNNGASATAAARANDTMAFLRSQIKHVIYIIKENRTYDQVLGDLEKGNGDPSLAMFPEPITPNHHRLARQFVTLDNFYCSGAVSGDGWVWGTAGRTSDFTEKTIAVNYAGRGLSYDYEGMNRNINVAQATVAERQAANPFVPDDPDLLPGTADVAALDGPDGEQGKGYIWDAALNAGLRVRNYGFYGDWILNYLPEGQGYPPLLREPRREGVRVFYPAATGLMNVSDPYYREYDMDLPDFWRFKEWEHEFDEYVRRRSLPHLMLIELPHDHFGSFGSALDGVNTPETQMADNDYALGLIVEKVARSPFAHNTLIFVVEDDAQDGPDHVDAQRTVALVIGPYVKQGAVVSNHYANPNMLRTIVDILGLEPMGLQVALAAPMSDVFDRSQQQWDYRAIVPEVLRTTSLPLPPRTAANHQPLAGASARYAKPTHDAAYWQEVFGDQDFKRADRLDTARFNRLLWEGLMGPGRPYPVERHGRDLSRNRAALLRDVAAGSPTEPR